MLGASPAPTSCPLTSACPLPTPTAPYPASQSTMDYVLDYVDEKFFTPYVYPETFEPDNIMRQFLTLFIITNLGGALLCMSCLGRAEGGLDCVGKGLKQAVRAARVSALPRHARCKVTMLIPPPNHLASPPNQQPTPLRLADLSTATFSYYFIFDHKIRSAPVPCPGVLALALRPCCGRSSRLVCPPHHCRT